MLGGMPRIFALLLAGLALVACSSAQTAAPNTNLFNGKDLDGWEMTATPAADSSSTFRFAPDGTLAVTGSPIGFLATKATYKNYRLHVEWRWPANAARNSNAGVLLHIASGPKDRAWPLSFQVQTKPTRAGDLLPMAGATFTEKLTSAPDAKTPQLDRHADSSEKPLGEWNSCDIVCRDGSIEITVNGVLQNKVSGAKPDSGRVGFQCEGTPYELRNVRLEKLD